MYFYLKKNYFSSLYYLFLLLFNKKKCFKLFFRKDINQSNLEGSSWMKIPLPNETGFFTCSSSPNGDLCAVNYYGELYLRTGISSLVPHGTTWISIELSTLHGGIRQISLGNKSMWSLDNQGNLFYRNGMSTDRFEGTYSKFTIKSNYC
jgi:hypothetical protein